MIFLFINFFKGRFQNFEITNNRQKTPKTQAQKTRE